MKPVQSADEVFGIIQEIKARAGTNFSTNFFPVRPKIESWIAQEELQIERGEKAVFFFRKDRNLLHLSFVAESPEGLEVELKALPGLNGSTITLDLVGPTNAIALPEQIFVKAGFHHYATLVRLARSSGKETVATESPEIVTVKRGDAAEILALLEDFFDPYADQIPLLYEVENALDARQIIAIKREEKIAAFIHFETQGVTSAIRYWMVAKEFREQGLGGTLLRHYFAVHPTVRRFTLWVNAANENALRKYERFGYAGDGLADHVLINQKITA
jgi:ribosomal protein S18 acetylase RimI-like enzyme